MANSDTAHDRAASAPGTKWAVIIGVDSYPVLRARAGLPHDPSLHGCVNDAVAVRDFCATSLGVAPANILLLLAPHPEDPLRPDLGTPPRATRAAIQQVFTTLAAQTRPSDEVVIYYAGHAARIGFNPNPGPDDERPFQPNQADPYENLSALAPDDTGWDGTNLLLSTELHASIQQVVKPGVRATVLLDCCHAATGTRGSLEQDPAMPRAVRQITLDPQDLNRAAFAAAHGPVPSPPATSGQRGLAVGESGWRLDLADLVTGAACQYDQLSHEYPAGDPHARGAFTRFLLEALTAASPSTAAGLTWDHIQPEVATGVAAAVRPHQQTPVFEGATQRPIFGGAWRPAPPGITVTTTPGSPLLTLSAGEMSGLLLDAEIAIYPPTTLDFAAADRQGSTPVKARVVSVAETSSQAAVFDSPSGAVADGSRARVTRPGTPRIGVALQGVPESLATAIRQAPEVTDYLDFAAPGEQAGVEVRSRTEVDGLDGWVLAQPRPGGSKLSPNDVIAYAVFWDPEHDPAPPPPQPAPLDPATLGTAIGAGLVQWARYQAVRTRTHDVAGLDHALGFTLRVATDSATLQQTSCADETLTRTQTASAPIPVRDDELLLCKVKVTEASPGPLNLAILGCSDDGNVFLLWPPQHGWNQLAVTEEQCVGLGARYTPFRFLLRPDQTQASYTLKLFASDQAHPFDTRSLCLDDTVQAIINARLAAPRGLPTTAAGEASVPISAPVQYWTVRDLPIMIRRHSAPPATLVSPPVFTPNVVKLPRVEHIPSGAAHTDARALAAGTQGVRLQLQTLQILDGLRSGFLGMGAATGVYVITSVVDGLGSQPITFKGDTYRNLNNGDVVPLGAQGDPTAVFNVYLRLPPLPDFLSFSVLVLRSNADLRQLGSVITQVLADDRYKALAQILQTATTAANPAVALVTQVAQEMMGLFGDYLKAKPDDQLGYYQAVYTNLFDNLGVGPHPPRGTLLVDKISLRYQIDAAPPV